MQQWNLRDQMQRAEDAGAEECEAVRVELLG
jgi:hypothetical protein